MTTYRIANTKSGAELGTYEAETAEGAIAAMLADAGCDEPASPHLVAVETSPARVAAATSLEDLRDQAAWSGNGNTDADGDTTEDLRITLAEDDEPTTYSVSVTDGDGSGGGPANWDVSEIDPVQADSVEEALEILEDWARGEAAGISDYDDGGTLTLYVTGPDGTGDHRTITLEAETDQTAEQIRTEAAQERADAEKAMRAADETIALLHRPTH